MEGRYTLCLNYAKPESGHRHYGFINNGANCEYNTYTTKSLHKIADNLSFVHASLLDTCGVALHGVDMAGVTPGGTAAIWGPGPVGLCALQIIRGMGSARVIMVGRGQRLKTAGELGASILIDYEKEDPVKCIKEITGGIGVDEIQLCSGGSDNLDLCMRSVKKGGKINMIGFFDDASVSIPHLTTVVMNELVISGSRANPNVSDRVLSMLAAGIIKGDKIVTHTFPLEEYGKAIETFVTRKDGAIKVVVEP